VDKLRNDFTILIESDDQRVLKERTEVEESQVKRPRTSLVAIRLLKTLEESNADSLLQLGTEMDDTVLRSKADLIFQNAGII
jgi:hypothetical protein